MSRKKGVYTHSDEAREKIKESWNNNRAQRIINIKKANSLEKNKIKRSNGLKEAWKRNRVKWSNAVRKGINKIDVLKKKREFRHSKESKKKISDTMKQKIKAGLIINAFTFGEKHSKYNLGKKLSKELRNLISVKTKIGMNKPEVRKKVLKSNQGGPLSKGWKGGISFDPYDYFFSDQFRIFIKNRDLNTCVVCNKNKKILSVHHINYDKRLSIPQNCVTLCSSCHGKTNWNRKEWIAYFFILLNRKHNYQYTKGEILLYAI